MMKRTLKKIDNYYWSYGREDNINKIVIFNRSEIAIQLCLDGKNSSKKKNKKEQ